MRKCSSLSNLRPAPTMIVERLYISPQSAAPLVGKRQITLLAGQGIRGDRHCGSADWPGQNLTLVEAEEIEAFCRLSGQPDDLALTRRNIVTRGIRLNHLIGRRFRIGNCLLLGIELCEPCRGLGERLATPALDMPAVVRYWTGRGGLRVDVLNDGQITVGDAILPQELPD